MNFTVSSENLTAFAIGLVVMLFVMGMLRRKQSSGDGFWSKVFQSNQDLDTTIGIVIGAFLVIFCIVSFQDGIDSSEGGYIVLAGLNGWFALAGYKKGFKDGTKENGNGKT